MPVSSLKNFIPSHLQNLNKLGISDIEQFIGIATCKESREFLANDLKIKSQEVANLVEDIRKIISPAIFSIAEVIQQEFPLGALKPRDNKNKGIDLFEMFVPDSPGGASSAAKKKISRLVKSVTVLQSLASSINYVRKLPRVRNQAGRGTCVAHAVTCINEFAHAQTGASSPDLSEQHLYFETKLIDGMPTACGTWIIEAMKALAQVGQCSEVVWSYNPNPPCNQHIGKPSHADQNATQYKNYSIQLNPNEITAIKTFLAQGNLVAFSIPVYRSWLQSGETVRSGRITMPLPGESEISGHAMTIVGYQDQQEYPGGGYFIIRNSWGEQWGYQNIYAPGYGTIPYAYIQQYNWEAFCIV